MNNQNQSVPFVESDIETEDLSTVSRYKGAPWFKLASVTRVLIAGLGGIGSHTAFLMSRIHPNGVTLIDPDSVEAANLSGQLYSNPQIGLTKVKACSNTINAYSSLYNCTCFTMPVEELSLTVLPHINICGFDNMQARKDLFKIFKSYVETIPDRPDDSKQQAADDWSNTYKDTYLFIDGRLNAEEFQIFAINGADKYHMEKYEKDYLFDDENVEEGICSFKQTTYCASMIASLITNLSVNFLATMSNPKIPRPVPFFTYYNAQTMFFKQED